MILLKIDSDTYHLIDSHIIIDNEIIYYTTDSLRIHENNCRILSHTRFKVDYLLKLNTDKKISEREKLLASKIFHEKNMKKTVKEMSNDEFRNWRSSQIKNYSFKELLNENLIKFFNLFKTEKMKRKSEHDELSSILIINEIFGKITEEEWTKIFKDEFEEILNNTTKSD